MWCKKVSGGGLALIVALAALCISSTAEAYCRSRTCSLGKEDFEADAECEHEDGCVSEGKRLHWASPCLRYAVQADGSPVRGIDADQAAELVEQAFALWKSAECPGGGNPRFDAGFQGFVACHEQQAVCAGASGNVSVVMFHDQVWPYDPNELGITTPTAGLDTGVIHDADIEINTVALVDPVDVFPVLAHEVGHFLGLTHSNASGALMSEYESSIGTSGELLTADDMAGICDIYPPKDSALSCETRAPARDECANDPEPIETCRLATTQHGTSSGCSMARAGSQRDEAPLAVLGFALGLVGLSRRRGKPTRQVWFR